MRILLAVFLLATSLLASAETMQYTLCTLKDGKTIQDAQTWLDDWRKLIKNENVNYKLRLLLPHADAVQLGQFYIEGASPTLSTYAASWEWWYSNEKAQASNAQLVSIASCGANSIYMSTD